MTAIETAPSDLEVAPATASPPQAEAGATAAQPALAAGTRDMPARVLAGLALACAIGVGVAVGVSMVPGASPIGVPGPNAMRGAALANVPPVATPEQASLLMATEYLTTAMSTSRPFETELAVAIQLLGDRPPFVTLLDELIPFADSGVPDRADLALRFREDARALEGGGPGAVFGWMEAGLNGMLQYNRAALRRDEEYAALAAEASAGDLEAATARLSRLDGPARQALADWLVVATARVNVDAIGVELNRRAHLAILGETG